MLTILAFLTVLAIVMPQPAHAYIDPCAGGYIVQAVLGFILAAGASIRGYFKIRRKSQTEASRKKEEKRELCGTSRR